MEEDMEETGLYDDLNSVDLGELVTKLEDDKETLCQQIKTLEEHVESLLAELTTMRETEKSLSRNISELYKTAKTEIDRKDRMICDLQAQKDNLLFRRINRANEGKQFKNHDNAKRIKQEVLDENPSKRRKCENEPPPPVVKTEPGRHSPRSQGSSHSREFKDRHSNYSKDRHRDFGGGSSRRNRTNESSDRNRSRYHGKGEDSEVKVEHKSDSKPSLDSTTNKFKHKQDFTKHTKESSRGGKERGRNESSSVSERQNFRKHDIRESASSDRKRKHDSSRKSSVEKENEGGKVNGPINKSSKGIKNLVDESSSKPAAAGDCNDGGKVNGPINRSSKGIKNLVDESSSKSAAADDWNSLPHWKNAFKGEDKSGSDRKKSQSMKPFAFFDETLSEVKDTNPVRVPQPMDCEDSLNSKKEEKLSPTEKKPVLDEQQISNDAELNSKSVKEDKRSIKELKISPRHDNLMNYLEIQPKEEKRDEKLVSDDCNNKKLKSKKKEEKGKSKGEKKSHTSTSSRSSERKSSSDGRSRSERDSESGKKHEKSRSKKSDKSSTRKHESKEKLKKNAESDSQEMDKLCKERELIQQALLLEMYFGDEEAPAHKSSSDEANKAQVTFLANVHISPVIKAKKGATNRLQECIEKLEERETTANSVVTSNQNPEENHQTNEITSSYRDEPISSPTSSTNQIITKRAPRLENIIDKLSAKGPNNSRYDVFAEIANQVAHSTLKINDCQLSSTNTTVTEENLNSQPGTSTIMNNSNLVVPKLTIVNGEIIKIQPDTVKPQPPTTDSNSNCVTNNKATNNNNSTLEKSKTDSVDPNISSSSEPLNVSNSTIMLNSTISLNSSSENRSSVKSVFNNRRRRCVVKIVN